MINVFQCIHTTTKFSQTRFQCGLTAPCERGASPKPNPNPNPMLYEVVEYIATTGTGPDNAPDLELVWRGWPVFCRFRFAVTARNGLGTKSQKAVWNVGLSADSQELIGHIGS